MKHVNLSTGLAWAALCVLLPLGASLALSSSGEAEPGQQKVNHYIGAAKCKSCHSSKETGDQHGEWSKSRHAHAFETLGGDAAKKIATEKGLADPQKAPECVKCHVTGHGLPEDHFKKGFELKAGVQCETCHGPGEEHVKARMAAAMGGGEDEGFGDEAPAYVPVPAGEIIASPAEATCRGCHNAESPTFERFCFYEFRDKVSHLNPKKPRTQAELDARMVCGCGEACPCVDSCAEHECAVPQGSLKDEGK